jgi:hypothetical protein
LALQARHGDSTLTKWAFVYDLSSDTLKEIHHLKRAQRGRCGSTCTRPTALPRRRGTAAAHVAPCTGTTHLSR